jgi:tRNA A-37 threonylcarbamoyl transferase component Bud32
LTGVIGEINWSRRRIICTLWWKKRGKDGKYIQKIAQSGRKDVKSRALVISLFILSIFSVVSASLHAVPAEPPSCKLKIMPASGIGISQGEMTGATVTLGGPKSLSGKLNNGGLVVDSAGYPVRLTPGEWSVTVTIAGYDPYKTTLSVEEAEGGMPPLDVSLHISPKKTAVAPGGGGGTVSPARGEELWGWLTAALVIVIGALAVAIAFVVRRRGESSAGGAAVSPAAPSPPSTTRKKKAVPEPPKVSDDEPAVLAEERYTGKRFGRYLVTRTIGWGGMASVLEAEFTKGGKTVKAALKVPYDNYQRDDEFIGRFDQEARLGDVLFHENIIGLYEYGTTASGVRFIAMQYIEGADLRGLLAGQGRIDPTRAAQIVMDIAKALDYAHGQSPPVYHRDIKPENILFRDAAGEGAAILTDFGIATQGGTMGTGKALIGTALYACPDSAKGHPVGPGYDIYSLGVVFYEMLTGRQPFTGADYYAIMRRHEEEVPPPPADIAPDIPEELSEMVMKMLEKDPKNRYRSAKELLVELRDFLTK